MMIREKRTHGNKLCNTLPIISKFAYIPFCKECQCHHLIQVKLYVGELCFDRVLFSFESEVVTEVTEPVFKSVFKSVFKVDFVEL